MTMTEIVVQTQPSVLEWIAAGATLLSAGVIAWQAWLTRRSVQASEDAVTVAQAALTESQLARVENGVPRITVSTRPYSQADKLWRVSASGRVAVPEGEIFKLPRDADVQLSFAHKMLVRNDGPGTVVPRFETSRSVYVSGIPQPIAPGTEKEFEFNVTHSVAEWVRSLMPKTTGEGKMVYPVSGTLDVVYAGPRDSDVDETHPLIIRGSALIPVADAEGDWRRYNEIEWDDSLTVRVAPATRVYWRSRSANEKFETKSG